MGFGDFVDQCSHAALPFCPLLGTSAVSAEAGLQANCYARTISLANTIIFQGAASFVHIGALIMTVIMIFHVRSKFTAVGRKEITTFFYLYFLLTFFSLILDAGVVPPGSGADPYFAAVQIGLASATCMSLWFSGLVGFQVYEDGTPLSVWLLRGSSFVWGAIVFLVALLTFEGWGGLGPTNTTGLFVLMYIFNGLLLVVYVGMQVLLVVGTLEEWWPLGNIAFGVFFFVVGQVILYTVGDTLCERVEHYFDGLFIASVTNLLAVMMIYKYWDSITTEDLEFSVGVRSNNWDVKDPPVPPHYASTTGSAQLTARSSISGLDRHFIGETYEHQMGGGSSKKGANVSETMLREDRKSSVGYTYDRKPSYDSRSPYAYNHGRAANSTNLLPQSPPGGNAARKRDSRGFEYSPLG